MFGGHGLQYSTSLLTIQHMQPSVSLPLGLGRLHKSCLQKYTVYSLGQVRDFISSSWIRGESSMTFMVVACGCTVQRGLPLPSPP